MNRCYICGNEFNSTSTKKHDEHIIQQAIGGSLTADEILCESCGGNLGNEIDAPFNKIFSGLSIRLDIKTDRGSNKKLSVAGKYISNQDRYGIKIDEIDVLWNDFKVSPTTPFHKYTENKEKVIIYANKKTAASYKNKVIKELENFANYNKPEIIICDDLDGWVNFPFSPETIAFSRGFAKIAIGFASKCGIPRENMNLALHINATTNSAKIINKPILIQFYPPGKIDYLLESEKHNLSHYPYHLITLFTIPNNQKKLLVCYIELFSTFQWYVILGDNYEGDEIYKYYAQEITKKDDPQFTPGSRYYKERNMILSDLGITEEKMENYKNKHRETKSPKEAELDLIQQEFIKQKYNFEFEDHISNSISYISNKLTIKIKSKTIKSNDK